MTRWLDYLFNIWSFRAMNIYVETLTCNNKSVNILRSTKPGLDGTIFQTLNKPEKLPKTLIFLPKWQNFAKSGHTVCT